MKVSRILKLIATPLLFALSATFIFLGNNAIDISNSREASPYLFKMLYLISFACVGISMYFDAVVCKSLSKETILYRLIAVAERVIIIILLMVNILSLTMAYDHGREVWGVIAGFQFIQVVFLLMPNKFFRKAKAVKV